VRSIVTLALAVSLGILTGCGNSTGPPTTSATTGASVGADRYLADTAAAADAVRVFAAALDTKGAPATPERLKALVPQLDPPLARAKLAGQRLSAEVVADRRLDKQRSQSAAGFATTVTAMERVRDAAAAGNPGAARTASIELTQALTALRSATPAP
jgi:hypothetical protein